MADLNALIQHLERTTALDNGAARRVVDEVVAFFDHDIEDFVRARHAELKAEGWRNDAIYQRIVADTAEWRFVAPTLTERQVRRMIYG